MQFFKVSDIVIHGEIYMRRWRVRTKWFGLHLHHIRLPDYGRDFHDHPFDFMSIAVKGSYEELLPDGALVHHRWGVPYFRRAEAAHAIVQVPDDGVWTFVLRGPLRRPWGFYVDDVWMDADSYFEKDQRDRV